MYLILFCLLRNRFVGCLEAQDTSILGRKGRGLESFTPLRKLSVDSDDEAFVGLNSCDENDEFQVSTITCLKDLLFDNMFGKQLVTN